MLHGSSTATYDLDVVMPFTRENCERLLAAVSPLRPRLSHTADKRPLSLDADALAKFKNLYLTTDAARLDVLGSLPPLPDLEQVMAHADSMDVGGIRVLVVSIEHLIQVASRTCPSSSTKARC